MVYAVISDMKFSPVTTGTIRLVNKGEIPLPKTIHDTFDGGLAFYDETYFSNYSEAKTIVEDLKNDQRRNGQVSFVDET